MDKIEFHNPEQVSQLFQQAVDQAIENHRQKGEAIAVSDERGKVKVISADEIPSWQLEKEKEQTVSYERQ